MKYLSALLSLIFVFSISAMQEKPRRDCCYLAGLAKNSVSNAPGALFYTGEEYIIKATISSLDKVQKIFVLTENAAKQKSE
ncbi:hypothetical protein BH09DEP1_BH09DEP1_2340 [soil metagenome]